MKLGLAIILVAFVVLACGPGPGATATPGTTPGTTPGAEGSTVDIVDFGFRPASVEVSTGATVRWTNTGAVAHTVTFEDGSANSGSLAAGATFEHTFSSAGTFAYVCDFHPTMRGTVVVD